MKPLFAWMLVVAACGAGPADVRAYTSYIGYSGAPGSSGYCASSCHGTGGGTVQVSGFPAEYVPGQQYTVTVSHSAGLTIKQFNGSCRIGTGSANAGIIAAGAGTATYSTSGETNGVRLSASDQNSATFLWTAPAQGTGAVRHFVAGHQGSTGGQNTNLTLVSNEQVAGAPDGEGSGAATRLILAGNFPNPFRDRTAISYVLPAAGTVVLEVFGPSGRLLRTHARNEGAGQHEFLWNGAELAPGVYFYRLSSGEWSETATMLLIE
jgi:hypothetical protein